MKSQNNLLLGQAISLLLTSEFHRNWYVSDLERLILPPIRSGRILTDEQDGNLLAFATWTFLDTEAEEGYLDGSRKLQPSDFESCRGNFWFIDMVSHPEYDNMHSFSKRLKTKRIEVAGEDSTAFFKRIKQNKSTKIHGEYLL